MSLKRSQIIPFNKAKRKVGPLFLNVRMFGFLNRSSDPTHQDGRPSYCIIILIKYDTVITKGVLTSKLTDFFFIFLFLLLWFCDKKSHKSVSRKSQISYKVTENRKKIWKIIWRVQKFFVLKKVTPRLWTVVSFHLTKRLHDRKYYYRDMFRRSFMWVSK